MVESREVMTPKQVAEYLQLHPMTVYRFIRQGKIPAAKIGGRYRIKRDSVEKLLSETNVKTEGGQSIP
jgi:excisionase family DNA binding protein